MHNPHILLIQTINADWCDKDIVLLHACFQLLTDFVEKEEPEVPTDWQFDEAHKNAKREIDELYAWWKDRVSKAEAGKLGPLWDESQYKNDNDMLMRLINVRRYLWT